jgi:hypothetical protein
MFGIARSGIQRVDILQLQAAASRAARPSIWDVAAKEIDFGGREAISRRIQIGRGA